MRLQASQDSTVEFYTLRGPLLATPPSRPRPRPRPRAESEELTPVADPIAKLTRECSALRLKLATAERRERNSYHAQSPGYRTAPASARTPPYPTLPLLLAATDGVLAHRGEPTRTGHLHGEMAKLAERHRALEKTLREMQDALRAKDREIEMLRAERDRLLAERDEVRAKSRSVSRERSQVSMADDYSVASGSGRGRGDRHHHQRHRDRSRSRRGLRRSDEVPPLPVGPAMAMAMDAEQYARAQSMEIFLTKTDGWSGAQIIQAVDDLNAEINQFAAAATESCSFAKRAKAKAPLTLTPDQENTTPWLGPALSHILAFRDHTQDPILVQLALQASIVTCCARSLSLFCVGFPSKLDALLSRILVHMQTSGAYLPPLTQGPLLELLRPLQSLKRRHRAGVP